MIRLLDHTDPHTARLIVHVQRPAYEREADIIQFKGIPQLNETAGDVMDSGETFVGWPSILIMSEKALERRFCSFCLRRKRICLK